MKALRIAACMAAAAGAAFAQAAPVATAPSGRGAEPGKGIIEGQVFSLATGGPLKKATVRLIGLGARQSGGMPQTVAKETDEQGRFSFTGLDAGRYNLSAERQGFLRQSYGGRKYNTNGTPIALAQDQHVKDIVLKLSPQAVITGKVLDEDGDPVANVQVRAFKVAYRLGKKQWTQVGNAGTSDIGEYRIANLNPGTYLVATNSRNQANLMLQPSGDALPDNPDTVYGATYFPNALDSANAQPLEVAAGAEVRGIDVRLRKTQVFRIRGKVANVTGGRGNVMVMLSPKDGMNIASSSPARGPEYRFELRGVTPGSYVVHAQTGSNNQPAIAFQDVRVSNSHVDNLVLTVEPGNDVQGTVKIEDATAPVDVPNLSVFLRTSMPLTMGGPPRGKAGSDLKFTLKSVAPLQYTVSVSGVPDNCFVKSIRYAGQEVPEDGIAINSAGEMTITLSATAGEVDGAVVDKAGKPVPGAIVALIPKDGPASAIQSRFGDENGAVTFKGLKPGEYRLIAWEDIPSGALQDPEFVKPFEGRGEAVKLDPGAKQAVQVKVIPAEETDK